MGFYIHDEQERLETAKLFVSICLEPDPEAYRFSAKPFCEAAIGYISADQLRPILSELGYELNPNETMAFTKYKENEKNWKVLRRFFDYELLASDYTHKNHWAASKVYRGWFGVVCRYAKHRNMPVMEVFQNCSYKDICFDEEAYKPPYSD